jgi:hypothetical protein
MCATSGRLPTALFFYSPHRKGEHPQAHLKDFRGVIHADGYAGFNELFVGGRIVEAGCWAHVRRKFFDVHAERAYLSVCDGFVRVEFSRHLFEEALPVALACRVARERSVEHRLHANPKDDADNLNLHREPDRVEFGDRSPRQDLGRTLERHSKQMLDLVCRR